MAMLRRRRHDEIDPFSDLLFNTLLIFVLLFAIALLAMNPKAKTGVIDAKAEFIITVTWPDGNPNDIDAWVADPQDRKVWFRAREAGLMHLDRDDRGLSNDTILVAGREVVNPLNQEVVTLRGIAAGEYTVNAHYYQSQDGKPVPLSISVVKVNPRAEVVYYGQATLARQGDETTLVRFVLDREGRVVSLNHLPRSLVERL